MPCEAFLHASISHCVTGAISITSIDLVPSKNLCQKVRNGENVRPKTGLHFFFETFFAGRDLNCRDLRVKVKVVKEGERMHAMHGQNNFGAAFVLSKAPK